MSARSNVFLKVKPRELKNERLVLFDCDVLMHYHVVSHIALMKQQNINHSTLAH